MQLKRRNLRYGTYIAIESRVVQKSEREAIRPLDARLKFRRRQEMLWTIFIILLVLWALGFGVAGAALGNLVHILLVVAVVVLIVQLVSGRRAL